MYLENINGPEDIKKLNLEELKVLADETRAALINKISNAGGPFNVEDGELMGGFGQNIASFYGDSNMKVKNYGISKAFHTDFEAEELLDENGISVDKISKVIKEYFEKK